MKTVLQLIFILFYLSSAFVVGQIRTVQFVQEIEHANAGSRELTIDASCADLNGGLPRYRDAKKATNDLQYRPEWNIAFGPCNNVQAPAIHGLTIISRFALLPSKSRAPPLS